jgi:hypothetical protein
MRDDIIIRVCRILHALANRPHTISELSDIAECSTRHVRRYVDDISLVFTVSEKERRPVAFYIENFDFRDSRFARSECKKCR